MTSSKRDNEPLADNLSRKLLERFLRYTNRYGNWLTTYHKRPNYADQVISWPDPDVSHARMAIVMQGPIAMDGNFTVETLKLYARHMPGCELILSTWNDAPADALDPIRQLGVRVILSEKPANMGLFNVNAQLVSAGAGVRAAVAGGAEWILKTRTDQRLGDRNALAFLRAIAQSFPPAPNSGQRCRIVGVSYGSLKFAPYHPTDQTVFGHADDMLVYWTPPLRTEAPPAGWPADAFIKLPIGYLCRHGAAESYIGSQFLAATGWDLKWTLADTWAAYRDRFCFIDPVMVNFYWEKGQKVSLMENLHRYDMITNRYEMGFGEWLLLHTGQVSAESGARYESALETRFNERVHEPA